MGDSFIKLIFRGQDPTTFDLETVARVLEFLRNFLFSIAAFEAIIGLLMVGFQYFTAYGEEAKIAQAKKTLYFVIIGMVIIIMSEVIVYEVQRVILADTSHPVPIQEVTDPLK